MSQRDAVRASLLADAQRETHHDYYARRRPRLRPDPIAVNVTADSIRDLGALMVAATTPQERAWLVLRLRNRLDVLDALEGRS